MNLFNSWIVTVLCLVLPICAGATGVVTDKEKARVELEQMIDKIPLAFEANKGQMDESFHFLSRGPGYNLFLAPTESKVLLFKPTKMPEPELDRAAEIQPTELPAPETAFIGMKLEGANADAKSSGLDLTEMKSNYFFGADKTKWHSNIDNFSKVQFEQIYPGIDLVYYGKQRQLEYDFVVQPGADYQSIQMVFEGAESIELNKNGDLILKTKIGDLSFKIPEIYQEQDDKHLPVTGKFVLNGKNRVGFEIASYDAEKALVIDPTLTYSTFVGGSWVEYGTGITADASGIYVTGMTVSADFPFTAGAFDTEYNSRLGFWDNVVFKLDPITSSYIYATFLGGGGHEDFPSIAVDSTGSAYIAGRTLSSDFPVTPGAFSGSINRLDSIYVTKLSPNGSTLVYSTLLGGRGAENGVYLTDNIAVDSSGSAYVMGTTNSAEFPLTPGAFSTSLSGQNDLFVTKLSPDGSHLIYSTLLGGSFQETTTGGIALDSSGAAYVMGATKSIDFPVTAGAVDTTYNGNWDLFVSKISPDGSSLIYSTYFGGTGDDSSRGSDIAVDASGFVYGVGTTQGNVPITAGVFDSTFNGDHDFFIFKLNQDGSSLIYSTYLGGSGVDEYPSITIDVNGSAYITGLMRFDPSAPPHFPVTEGVLDASTRQGINIAKLSPLGNALDFSIFFAYGFPYGNNFLDEAGNLCITGSTGNIFPTVNPTQASNAGSWDIYVSRISGFPSGVVLGEGDSTPPNITAPASVTVEATGPATSVWLGTATISDDVSASTNITVTNNAPATFALGATVITWTATDEAGNSASDTQVVTIVDTTAPALTPPDDVTVDATGTLTVVNIGTATASDLITANVIISNDAPSAFPVGSTTVTWTATDGVGNAVTGTQSITVLSPSGIINGLFADIASLNLPVGTQNSLNSKLNTATKVLNDSNPKNDQAGVNSLNALISSIQAQSGKKISVQDANELIARILNLIQLV